MNLTTKEYIGWGLFLAATVVAISTGYRIGGWNGAMTALSTAGYAAAGVLGISAARNTTTGGR